MTVDAAESIRASRLLWPLSIDPLDAGRRGAWRVCDRRFDAEDARSIVGFIEDRGDRVEVMLIADSFSWREFSSFDEAVGYACSVGEAQSSRRGHGPLAQLRGD